MWKIGEYIDTPNVYRFIFGFLYSNGNPGFSVLTTSAVKVGIEVETAKPLIKQKQYSQIKKKVS